MPQKINVDKDIRSDIDCCRISEAIRNLQYLLEEYGDKSLWVSTVDEYGDVVPTITINIERDETPQEEKDRLAREQRSLDWERKQYLALKKKFGE